MNKKNFLNETRTILNAYGYTPADIAYIGEPPQEDGSAYACTWEEFKKLADFDYSPRPTQDDHEQIIIAKDLIIVFRDNARLERGIPPEWGEQRWVMVPNIKIPKDTKRIITLMQNSQNYQIGALSTFNSITYIPIPESIWGEKGIDLDNDVLISFLIMKGLNIRTQYIAFFENVRICVPFKQLADQTRSLAPANAKWYVYKRYTIWPPEGNIKKTILVPTEQGAEIKLKSGE